MPRLACLHVGIVAQLVAAVAVGDGEEFAGEMRREYTLAGTGNLAVHYGWLGVAPRHEVAAHGVEIIVDDKADAGGVKPALGAAQQRGPV